MPNYVVNKLKVQGDKQKVKELFDFIKSDDGFCMDFNKITPMPKWVYNKDLSEKDEEKYGKENCWLEWRRKNWGTKWNAIKAEKSYYFNPSEPKEDTIFFETAWSGVPTLISKLGFIFPTVIIDYYWCDEDFGYNVGHITIQDTKVIGGTLEGGSPEAFDLACEISNTTLRDHCYNENYEYDESLEEEN